MAKKDTFIRYMLIVSKLRKQKSTFEEIRRYLQSESEYRGYQLDISKRTFQRDIKDIASLFDIEIKFDRSQGVYYIEYDESDKNRERIIEALDVFHALNMSEKLSAHIQFENNDSFGTQHLYGLLHAIKNRLQITLAHKKYWETDTSIKTLEPLAIKEFKKRWYLVAYELQDKKIKTYGLDRIQYFDILTTQFTGHSNFDVNKHFEHCFGIIKPDKLEPEEIELSFDPFQGLFIKALPIHHSQKIIQESEDEIRISLKMFITKDFLMEILSYGDTVRVIKPQRLVDTMKMSYMDVLSLYE